MKSNLSANVQLRHLETRNLGSVFTLFLGPSSGASFPHVDVTGRQYFVLVGNATQVNRERRLLARLAQSALRGPVQATRPFYCALVRRKP